MRMAAIETMTLRSSGTGPPLRKPAGLHGLRCWEGLGPAVSEGAGWGELGAAAGARGPGRGLVGRPVVLGRGLGGFYDGAVAIVDGGRPSGVGLTVAGVGVVGGVVHR